MARSYVLFALLFSCLHSDHPKKYTSTLAISISELTMGIEELESSSTLRKLPIPEPDAIDPVDVTYHSLYLEYTKNDSESGLHLRFSASASCTAFCRFALRAMLF